MTEVPEQRGGLGVVGRVLRGILLVAAPLAFLGLLEVFLATLDYGGRHPLFIESENLPGWLEPNPRAIQRYFPGRDTKLGIDPIPFKREKPEGGLRIVVQGGSTAAGFPFGRWAGLAGMLGDRLEAVDPESEIEVISTAMAAVNSYTLLDFVDEIIEIQPGAVLIYAGHNEFLGIFGAGSALTAARSRAATLLHLRLSRFRVYQLLDVLLAVIRETNAGDAEERVGGGDTLMAHAASSAEIPLDSSVFELGLKQFEGNLREILRRYQRAGIPVFLGTLVSNERNHAPFAGGISDAVDAAQSEALHLEAAQARADGNWKAARSVLETLLRLDPRAADVWFALAQVEQSAGNSGAARRAFRMAKEHDRLRFRAPEAFNQLIRQVAEEFDAESVDVEAHFAARAPLGVVGEELMLEHLHPNANGYFLLADAFYQALVRGRFISVAADSPSRDEARRDMPITVLDRVLAAQTVREIRGDFPFRPERIDVPFPTPRTPIEEIAQRLYDDPTTWLDCMESLLQLHLDTGRVRDAAVVARVTAQAVPWERAPNLAAAQLLLRLGQKRRALVYLERSWEADPDDPATLQLLVRLHLALEHEEQARAALAQLEVVSPEHPAVLDFDGFRKRIAKGLRAKKKQPE